MVMEQSGEMMAGVGTVAYMAPEVMDMYSRSDPAPVKMDGTKCDVFSFAILALYVATGCPPYEGLNNKQIFLKVLMSKQRTRIPDEYAGIEAENQASDYNSFVALVEQMW